MNITIASALIVQHLRSGAIDLATADRAHVAIRGDYYGVRMTGDSRRRMLALRFGIVDTATPVSDLLARSAAVEA